MKNIYIQNIKIDPIKFEVITYIYRDCLCDLFYGFKDNYTIYKRLKGVISILKSSKVNQLLSDTLNNSKSNKVKKVVIEIIGEIGGECFEKDILNLFEYFPYEVIIALNKIGSRLTLAYLWEKFNVDLIYESFSNPNNYIKNTYMKTKNEVDIEKEIPYSYGLIIGMSIEQIKLKGPN